MKLIGIGDGSYTSKKDGKRKEGYRLYLAGVKEDVAGKACEEVWVRKEVGSQFLAQFPSTDSALGKEVAVYYDRFGSVISLQVMEPVRK